MHRHLHTIKRDQLHFEVFQSPTMAYILDGSTKELYCLEETPVAIDWSSYLKINEQHLALTELHSNLFFLDIVHKLPFQIATIEEAIIQIAPTPIRIEKELCLSLIHI